MLLVKALFDISLTVISAPIGTLTVIRGRFTVTAPADVSART